MAHRHFLRGACRALVESQAPLRSSAYSKQGNKAAALRSVAQQVQGGPVFSNGLAQSLLMMRGVRQSCVQHVSAFSSSIPMGFAASAPSIAGPLSVLGSVAQHRGVASTDTNEDGEGDDADATYIRRAADPQNSLLRRTSGTDPPDIGSGRRIGVSGGSRGTRSRGSDPNAAGGSKDAAGDPLELLATARQLFTKRVRSNAQGATALPSLSPELREAVYGLGGVWDRVLVDVRRSARPMGRQAPREELYTAMVASGNMKGLFGLGIGIAETAQLAVARAHLDSMGRLAAVPLYRGHTLYHSVTHTYHKMEMRLDPRPEGWGLVCSDLLYELCGVAGLRNVSIKMRGGSRSNKFFVAQCFMEALLSQSAPHDGVESSGMYIREVFHGRKLPAGLVRGVDVM